MAGTTTYYGISYPTSTDYVKDGATAMQTIATGFDSVVAIPTYNNQTGTSYTFVLADTGKVVTANNASAVTFTIPPQSSVTWTANTSLRVTNLGAGALSIAGGAGVTVTNSSATVAQYSSATVIRTGSDAWTVVPAGSPSGLTLVNSTTITSQASVSFNNVFTSNYTNYRILLNCVNSGSGVLQMRLRASGSDNTTAIYQSQYLEAYGSTVGAGIDGNNNVWPITTVTTNRSYFIAEISNPQTTTLTAMQINAPINYNSSSGIINFSRVFGYNATTQFDGFTIYLSSGNLTGQISIYGYQK